MVLKKNIGCLLLASFEKIKCVSKYTAYKMVWGSLIGKQQGRWIPLQSTAIFHPQTIAVSQINDQFVD